MRSKQNSRATIVLAALAVAGIVAMGSTASAQHIGGGKLRFEEFERGSDRALREGKPMLLFFTAGWCHNCRQLADEAFTHPQVVKLSRHFVCILIDADEEPEICQQFEVEGYPTIQFLSPRGEPVERVLGKKTPRQLAGMMQSILQSRARRLQHATHGPRRQGE